MVKPDENPIDPDSWSACQAFNTDGSYFAVINHISLSAYSTCDLELIALIALRPVPKAIHASGDSIVKR